MVYIQLLILQTCLFQYPRVKRVKKVYLYMRRMVVHFTLFTQSHIKSSAFVIRLSAKFLIIVTFSRKSSWYDIIRRLGKQKVTSTLDALVRPLHARGWEITTTKIHRPATCVRLLEVQQSKMSQTGHLRNRTNHCTLHHECQEAQGLVGLFRFQRQHLLNLGILLQPIY